MGRDGGGVASDEIISWPRILHDFMLVVGVAPFLVDAGAAEGQFGVREVLKFGGQRVVWLQSWSINGNSVWVVLGLAWYFQGVDSIYIGVHLER